MPSQEPSSHPLSHLKLSKKFRVTNGLTQNCGQQRFDNNFLFFDPDPTKQNCPSTTFTRFGRPFPTWSPHQIRCAKKKVVSKMRWKLLPQTFQVVTSLNLNFVQCFLREHLRTVGTKLITSVTKCHVIFIAGLLNEHSDSDLSTKNSENGCPKTSFKLHFKCCTKLLWMLRRVML